MDEILRERIFEHLDDPEKRITKKYRELHASLVKQYQREKHVKNHAAYADFKEFKTDLYCDVIFDDKSLDLIEYVDLFDLLANKQMNAEENDELVELSHELSPKMAIEVLLKFIEGKCLGSNLIKARKIIEDGLKQTSNIHPTYNLYSGILSVLSLKEITPGQESNLLLSLNKITDFARVNVNESMPYMALLLQSVYFRTLFTQALHMFWKEHSRGIKTKDITALSNIALTKSFLGVLSKQVIDKIRSGIEDDDLLRTTAYLKKLYEFEQFINFGIGQQNDAQSYREHGFDTLNWLTVLMPFASRNVIINVIIQAGVYFQQASASGVHGNLSIKKADEKLALHAYMEANALANRSAPDLEIYTLVNTLKFIASFKYQDDDIRDVINALQNRVLLLVDIFPIYTGLQANINLLRGQDQTLDIMRSLLQTLMTVFNNNKSAANKISIDHKYVTVLYQAYEACVKNWYQQHYDPALENEFRLELMQLLLESNNWQFSDLDAHLTLPIAIRRDNEGWMEMTRPLKIANCGLKTYASLEGVEINNKTGEVKFTFSEFSKSAIKRASQNTLTIYDLMEMLEKNVTAAHFSLDPVDPQMMYHPFNAMRFAPDNIYKTQFLNTMLLSDYILKFLTIGHEVQGIYPYDMRSIKEATKNLPKHLQKIIDDFHVAQKYSIGSIHRFWIEAEQLTEAILNDDDNNAYKMAISDLKMVVKKHTMVRDAHGNLVDTQNDSEGWDIYVLTPQEKLQLDSGQRIITGPAMIFVIGSNKVSFIESEQIYKTMNLSSHDIEKVEDLENHRRENSGKVIVTIDNSMFIYRLIEGVAAVSEVPTYFSPEYIFAQEFTDHYDEFSEHILEFARLRELCKITAAIRFLDVKQSEAKQNMDHFEKLLRFIPDWEQRNSHACNSRDYFDLPRRGSMLSKEEMDNATFRHQNAELIKRMLPNSMYERHSNNLAPISEQIKSIKVTVNSPEVADICAVLLEKNRVAITEKHGEAAWDHNKNRIRQEILDKKSDYARDINDARIANMRKQLYEVFSKQLSNLPDSEMWDLIDRAMFGNIHHLANELARKESIETRQHLSKMCMGHMNVLEGLKHIGLAKEEDKHIELKDKCQWVPASVHHHIAGNNSQFIYGGVRVMPRVNVITSSSPRFNQTINNAFNVSGRATVGSSVIFSSNANIGPRTVNSSARIPATTSSARNYQSSTANAMPNRTSAASNSSSGSFTKNMTAELRKQGYQDHHIVSDKNGKTKGTVTEVFKRAGIDMTSSRTNKMFLPEREGLHATRSLHDGRHLNVVNAALEARLSKVKEKGEREGWSQSQYRQAVVSEIQREKGLLKKGERTLNKNKTKNARPQSPPPDF